jgi:5'-3' exonuclease
LCNLITTGLKTSENQFKVLIYNHHSPAGKKKRKSNERINKKTAVFSSKPRFLVLEITRNSGSLILKFQKPGTKG